MTVHKAKGLGFPVVILLLYGERNRGFRYIVQEDEGSMTLLRLKKGMLRSDDEFERRYREEETKAMVARLNSLYVALTRAGSELYVIGVKGEKDSFPFALIPKDACARIGAPPEVAGILAADEDASIEGFHHALALEAPPHSVEPLRLEEKKGELVHRLLSLIIYADGDVEGQIDELRPGNGGGSRQRTLPWRSQENDSKFPAGRLDRRMVRAPTGQNGEGGTGARR